MSAWSLAVVAVIVLAYALVSRGLGRTPVTAAIFFLSAGLVFGRLGWIDFGAGSETVRLLAEATLTLVLFADASRIDLAALKQEYLVPVRLLGIGLPLTIVTGCALAVVLFPSFSFGEALLLAIILAPTDAALGQAVVTDPRLPSRIRQGLNVESGLNDGICVPLLFIALALSDAEAHTKSAQGAVRLVAEAIGYGVLFGVVCGAAGAILLRLARERGLAEASWIPVVPVATAALSYGLAAPLGGSGFIASFVAGFTFGALRRDPEEAPSLLEDLGDLASAATFIVFGAVFAGPFLAHLSWNAVLYGLLSLTAVRMLPVTVAFARTHARPQTVAFMGWFGPRGLASIVFTVIVMDEANLPGITTITVAVVFTVVLSVYAHGLTSRPLTGRYASWFRAHPSDRKPPMEGVHAPPQRWRHRTAAAAQRRG
ncbi:MAG TPA: cation:proton antiporter [Gaiellaceae bacterium]|nr:cation:proton antiporter [Gaiellaceae bacterium]